MCLADNDTEARHKSLVDPRLFSFDRFINSNFLSANDEADRTFITSENSDVPLLESLEYLAVGMTETIVSPDGNERDFRGNVL